MIPMPADPRTTAFIRERARQLRRIARLDKQTARQVEAALKSADKAIRAELAGELSDFAAWRLPQLQASIRTELAALSEALAAVAGDAVAAGGALGSEMVTRPLAAGGVTIEATLTSVAAEQLLAIRASTTGRIRGIGPTLATEIDDALLLMLTGTTTRTGLLETVRRRLGVGRVRAHRIVNTEMGRAYSVASQDRMEAATEAGLDLKKQWRRSGKLKSRRDHDNADGQIVGVDESFSIGRAGHRLRFPRDPDPSVPAEQTINCGCTALPWMDGWPMENPGGKPYDRVELARLGGTTP